MPSIVYGGGAENLNIKIDSKVFRELLASSTSESFLVNLELDNGTKQLAFVQDIQHDNLKGGILHADFMAVSNDTPITAHLPVILEGEPEGVKTGGLLEQLLHSIDISCLPKDLPESLSADISALEISDTFTIGDLVLPEGVTASLGEDVVVATVAKARVAASEDGEEEGGEAPAAEAVAAE